MPKAGQVILRPFWQTTDGRTVRLYRGDVLDVLRRMPAKSVHTVVTSPPYWGLRDYGVDGQIGSEETVEEFVAKLVEVFTEVYRVLRDDGTVWLNIGDSYSGNGNLVGAPWRLALALQAEGWILRQDIIWAKPSPMPEAIKNRCTKAHEYIFLLAKQRSYYFDNEAIREKTGSETDPEEYAQLLELDRQRKEDWYQRYNGRKDSLGTGKKSGIRPGGISPPNGRNKRSVWSIAGTGYPGAHFATFPVKLVEPCILAGTSEYGCCTRCGAPWKRVVEETPVERERPNDYVKRTGAEGTGNSCANTVAGVDVKTWGWYPTCRCDGLPLLPKEPAVGKGWNRAKRNLGLAVIGNWKQGRIDDEKRIDGSLKRNSPERQAWVAECRKLVAKASRIAVAQSVVLDLFIGSGTTAACAIALGRHSVGIDLSDRYLRENAIPRIEGELLSRPALAHLAENKRQRLELGESL